MISGVLEAVEVAGSMIVTEAGSGIVEVESLDGCMVILLGALEALLSSVDELVSVKIVEVEISSVEDEVELIIVVEEF